MGDAFYIGQIFQFSGDFEFEGALFCDGRTLHINKYQVLFSIIGNRYGGDGISTFNLPKIDTVNNIRYMIVSENALYPERRY